jgi:putative pyruvate formate lyase activating enzyme
VLTSIAENISTGVHLSLMSQFHPTPLVNNHPHLSRPLFSQEYEAIVETMEELGFRNGWIQDMDSYLNYRPDFSRENPFE